MPAFLLKRFLNAAGVMLAVAFLAFLSFRFVGDPVDLMLNEQASQQQRDELRPTSVPTRASRCNSQPSSKTPPRAISASPTAISRMSSP